MSISLQHGDQPNYDGLLELFRQNHHEPYYARHIREDFGAIATHVRDRKAFIFKVMVFDKPLRRAAVTTLIRAIKGLAAAVDA